MKRYVLLAIILMVAISSFGATRTVLAEDFTATWCQYCPPVREAYMHIRADYTEDQVVVYMNHTGDGFANTYSNLRKGFVGVPGYPTYSVDVTHKYTGGGGSWTTHYARATAWIDAQLQEPAPCTLDIVPTRYNNEITVSTTVTLDTDISGRHDLWMCVYQESVGTWDLVVRGGMTPSHEISISSSGESETIDWTFDLDGSWDENDLYLVAFLNEYSGSKETVQAKMMYLDLSTINVEETTWGQIKANVE